MNVKGFEFSFTWLFVLLVGGSILALAIYSATQLVDSQTNVYNTELAAQLAVVLNPIETTLESGKYYPVNLPAETRLYNECGTSGTFGSQRFRLSARNGLSEEWPRAGTPISAPQKYLFSESVIEGKKYNFFASPFSMPYKIGDLLVVYTEKYCFVSPPQDVDENIESLGLGDVRVVPRVSECDEGENKVCFSGEACDVRVSFNSDGRTGVVSKGTSRMAFYDSLLYGAIFSEPSIYDCQVTRLKKRADALAQLYIEKSGVEGYNCASSLAIDLAVYSDKLKNNQTLTILASESEALDEANERLICPLF